VVVVAGSSYGLGGAIAERAKQRGAAVAIGARTREALEDAAVDLAVETDVADRAQVEGLVDATVERFGRIDTYVSARAVRRRSAPLLRAPGPGAARGLGRAEAALGPEAVPARGRPDPAQERLAQPAHAGAEGDGLGGQPLSPLPDDPGVHGRFDGQARGRTAWTWLRFHRGLIGAGLGWVRLGY
jgi:Enoyl-(Acyl carrier protein) reductase